MSWLEERLAATRGRRPYPVAALAVRLAIAGDDPQFVAKLAARLDLNHGWVRRCRRLGLTLAQADEWATRADLHPAEVWAGYARDLRGAALVNANRLTCPKGHPLDRTDGRGRRICGPCPAERVRKHRQKTVNTQVIAVVTDLNDLQEAM